MGTKAFLQKGRGKPGLVLPANAVERINQASDRSALIRVAEQEAAALEAKREAMAKHSADPLPNIGMSIAAKLKSTTSATASADIEPTVVETGAGVVPATLQPHPVEPEPEPKPADDLTKISGIGPALKQRLHRFGFKSFDELAKASAATLDEIQGVKGRGASIIESARKLADG